MDKKFLPWEDDELVFLSGDFTIERAEIPGLYNYTIGGIASARAVDGLQLVEWKMAELVSYSLLTPWENSGIEYTGEGDIMRNFLDDDPDPAKRDYIIVSDKKFVRVSKYYLVQNGLAKGNDSFVREVVQAQLSGSTAKQLKNYNVDCKPWVSDDILITRLPENVKIERGASEGKYRVKRGGIILNWTAARLVEEGYAIETYGFKLSALSYSTKANLSDFKDATRGFWLCDKPGKIKTLRDIARLWNELENNEDSALVRRITEHNNAVLEACAKNGSSLDEIGSVLDKLDGDIVKLNDNMAQLKNCVDELYQYKSRSILGGIGFYPETRDNYYDIQNIVKALLENAVRRMENVELGLGTAGASGFDESAAKGENDLFPTSVLPQKLKARLDAESGKMISSKVDYDARLDKLKLQATIKRNELQIAKTKYDEIMSRFGEVNSHVEGLIQRKKALDGVCDSLGDKRFKRPLIKKKFKDHYIRLISKVRVDRQSSTMFMIRDKFGTFSVTAEELVYMKLAEYYF